MSLPNVQVAKDMMAHATDTALKEEAFLSICDLLIMFAHVGEGWSQASRHPRTPPVQGGPEHGRVPQLLHLGKCQQCSWGHMLPCSDVFLRAYL